MLEECVVGVVVEMMKILSGAIILSSTGSLNFFGPLGDSFHHQELNYAFLHKIPIAIDCVKIVEFSPRALLCPPLVGKLACSR